MGKVEGQIWLRTVKGPSVVVAVMENGGSSVCSVAADGCCSSLTIMLVMETEWGGGGCSCFSLCIDFLSAGILCLPPPPPPMLPTSSICQMTEEQNHS